MGTLCAHMCTGGGGRARRRAALLCSTHGGGGHTEQVRGVSSRATVAQWRQRCSELHACVVKHLEGPACTASATTRAVTPRPPRPLRSCVLRPPAHALTCVLAICLANSGTSHLPCLPSPASTYFRAILRVDRHEGGVAGLGRRRLAADPCCSTVASHAMCARPHPARYMPACAACPVA